MGQGLALSEMQRCAGMEELINWDLSFWDSTPLYTWIWFYPWGVLSSTESPSPFLSSLSCRQSFELSLIFRKEKSSSFYLHVLTSPREVYYTATTTRFPKNFLFPIWETALYSITIWDTVLLHVTCMIEKFIALVLVSLVLASLCIPLSLKGSHYFR